MLIGGALLAAISRRRFTAVLFLSAVGYGMAALFVVEGAPDLALTQASIETLACSHGMVDSASDRRS